MNRKRCPWCGKTTDRAKDKIAWREVSTSAVPRFLNRGNCSHCNHKYGQVPLFSHILMISLVIVLCFALAFIFKSVFFIFLSLIGIPFVMLTPYSRLDDKGRPYKENADLLCKFEIVEKHGRIKRYELYFLDNSVENAEPFALASPINVYYTQRGGNTVLGEFSYIHEKNYKYMKKYVCNLYDTNMELVAKIRFITATDTEK